jgi:hypothetical protein
VPAPDRGVHEDDDQAKAVTLEVGLQRLPDGASSPTPVLPGMPARRIEVRITIGSDQRVGR